LQAACRSGAGNLPGEKQVSINDGKPSDKWKIMENESCIFYIN